MTTLTALSLVLITHTLHAHAALQGPRGSWWVKVGCRRTQGLNLILMSVDQVATAARRLNPDCLVWQEEVEGVYTQQHLQAYVHMVHRLHLYVQLHWSSHL